MRTMTEEVKSYKCNWCGDLYNTEVEADGCAFEHAKVNYANSLLNEGRNLETIKFLCGFHWDLTDNQKEIKKDDCKIIEIDFIGRFKLFGKGGWDVCRAEWVTVEELSKPHDPDEHFIDKK